MRPEIEYITREQYISAPFTMRYAFLRVMSESVIGLFTNPAYIEHYQRFVECEKELHSVNCELNNDDMLYRTGWCTCGEKFRNLKGGLK